MNAYAPALVIGGQRSGKSRYAEALAAADGRRPVYVATAIVGDAEMAARVRAHQARRSPNWGLVEAPLDLARVVAETARADCVVLVECLTLWLANVMSQGAAVDEETDLLLATLARLSGPVVLVSNEVGSGIVPENDMARRFADHLGILNQRVAEIAGQVILVAAGLPLALKPTGIG